ncbi:MAG: nucleotidyltransferase domain-containing protein [Hydrogenophaga sp.]|uniref:nucleotidyltransferase domain-containing protein n=1 Tax=Hydrogenophaga sp. TaxID=1904254 RepID=UPI002745B5D1|nr:nucleotidyltransferase domain-containing protein [Hydrogenophaga sp.]MDP2419034.1 nucleotidyltransferase domain-containing protein [Hydrogenophaga sp.]MDZ4190344.1 nucleotidyltransferase domain-containing protein [Hydrogenophaga sp.]
MRLNPEQIQTIKQVGRQVLGEDSRVVLFGSRVSDHMLGGDIDLLFESSHVVKRPAAAVCELYGALVMQLGEQKIDVLIKDPSTPMAPVVQRALSTGVVL